MSFESVIGQLRVKKLITSAFQRNRLAHGYLFHGPPGVGKDAMGIHLAMGLNCTAGQLDGCGQCQSCRQIIQLEHPSFRFVFPVPSRPKGMKQDKYNILIREKSLERIKNPYRNSSFTPETSTLPSIGIEQIRALKQEVILKQQSGYYRVFLISSAEEMTLPASNSLLKLLEEPPSGTILILTTASPNRILPTIASRCQTIRFDALSVKDVEKALMGFSKLDEDNARFFSRMSNGSMQRALSLIDEHFEEFRNAAWNFLEISLQGNHLHRLAECDQLIQNLDRAGIESMLELLLTYFRDLLCIQTGVPEKMINIDRENLMIRFLKHHEDLNLNEALSSVEHAIASLKKNVYLDLIVHSLSQNLYGLIPSQK